MRIISGKYGGRLLRAPSGGKTHPMSERIRGALFNVLGDVEGLSILDAYGGSGALSLEAISRGASYAQIVDNDKNAVKIIQQNVKFLGVINQVKTTQANILSWSNNNQDKLYDLVFIDPPFNRLNLEHIKQLTKHLKNSSTMIISYTGRRSAPTVNGVVVVDNRSYGDAALAFYRLDV